MAQVEAPSRAVARAPAAGLAGGGNSLAKEGARVQGILTLAAFPVR